MKKEAVPADSTTRQPVETIEDVAAGRSQAHYWRVDAVGLVRHHPHVTAAVAKSAGQQEVHQPHVIDAAFKPWQCFRTPIIDTNEKGTAATASVGGGRAPTRGKH